MLIFYSQESYESKLVHLVKELSLLSKFTKVVWLYQYPIVEKYAENGQHSTKIFSEKMHRYKLAARRILKYLNVLRERCDRLSVD